MKKLLQLPVEVLISAACAAVLVVGVTAQVTSGGSLLNLANAADNTAPEAKADGGCGSEAAAAEGGCPLAAMKARLARESHGGCPFKAKAARAAADGAVVPAIEMKSGCDEAGMCPSKAAKTAARDAAKSAVVPAVDSTETCVIGSLASRAVADALEPVLIPAVGKTETCDQAGSCPLKGAKAEACDEAGSCPLKGAKDAGCCPGEAAPTQHEAAPVEGTKVAQAETPALTE